MFNIIMAFHMLVLNYYGNMIKRIALFSTHNRLKSSYVRLKRIVKSTANYTLLAVLYRLCV